MPGLFIIPFEVKMNKYILKKIIGMVITVFAVLCLNFIIFRLAPGDPIRMMFHDPRSSEEQFELAKQKYGLDKPISYQFVAYLKNVAKGDLGESFWKKKPVLLIIMERVPATLLLVLTSLGLAIVLGIFLGAIAGWRNGSKLDSAILTASLTLYSIPKFALGIVLLLIFAYLVPILPFGGIKTPATGYTGFRYALDVAKHMVLPTVSILLWYFGEYIILTRSSMLDVMHEEFIETARSKGLPDKQILRKHALRNALLPIATITEVNIGLALAGVIEAETVFSWPGIGRLTYEAVMKRDYPLLQGLFLVFAVSIVLANFIMDLLYVYIDPRIGREH